MYLLKRSMRTETAHLLIDHEGLCANVHGHSYKWTVKVESAELDGTNMVMDFGQLKDIMNDKIGAYDHAIVVDHETFELYKSKLGQAWTDLRVILYSGQPTAEAMAKVLYGKISTCLPPGVRLVSVACRETRNNTAIYRG